MQEKDFPRYMQRCLDLAKQAEYYVAPNPMVGAVLVDEKGTIISEGWHEQYGGPHAEVNCLKGFPPHGGTEGGLLFVSLEPCSHYGKTPPCADLIIEKGIGHVVVGCLDPNPQVAGNGVRKLQEAGIRVTVGVLEKECRALNKRFICKHEKGRPYVILKWAQTADGVLGVSQLTAHNAQLTTQPRLVISNPQTKQIVHRMRAENMAIMVGTNTALLDNPKLLNTHWEGRHPIRILLDRQHRVPATAKIFSPESPTIVYDNTDLHFVLHDMAERNIHSVLVEGGACVLRSFLEAGLYDEVHVEVSSKTCAELLNDQPYIQPDNLVKIYAPEVPLPAMPDQVIDGNRLFTILQP